MVLLLVHRSEQSTIPGNQGSCVRSERLGSCTASGITLAILETLLETLLEKPSARLYTAHPIFSWTESSQLSSLQNTQWDLGCGSVLAVLLFVCRQLKKFPASCRCSVLAFSDALAALSKADIYLARP